MSESKLNLMRNLAFGAAGVLVANILLLAQIGARDGSLEVSLFASAVGLPIWVSHASILESYIFHGERAFEHLRSDFTINILVIQFMFGGLVIVTAIGSVIWHLSLTAAISFVVLCLVSFMVMGVHDVNLKKYLRTTDK
jgi:hypothetical protein